MRQSTWSHRRGEDIKFSPGSPDNLLKQTSVLERLRLLGGLPTVLGDEAEGRMNRPAAAA
jgi:hypothetical protein